MIRKASTILVIALFASSGVVIAQLREDVSKRDAYVTIDANTSNEVTTELFSGILDYNNAEIGLLAGEYSLKQQNLFVFHTPPIKLSNPVQFTGGSPLTENGAIRYRTPFLGHLLGNIFNVPVDEPLARIKF